MAKPSLNYVEEGVESFAVGQALYEEYVAQASAGSTKPGQIRSGRGEGHVAAEENQHGGWRIVHRCWGDGNVPGRIVRRAIEVARLEGYHVVEDDVIALIRKSYASSSRKTQARGPQRKLRNPGSKRRWY